jgi:predicted DNA-binding transcriptional regulator AlpA
MPDEDVNQVVNADATENEDATESVPRLALRAKDAAIALGIGARLLWSMTNRNEIPHIRLGKAVLYPVDALRTWLSEGATPKPRRR